MAQASSHSVKVSPTLLPRETSLAFPCGTLQQIGCRGDIFLGLYYTIVYEKFQDFVTVAITIHIVRTEVLIVDITCRGAFRFIGILVYDDCTNMLLLFWSLKTDVHAYADKRVYRTLQYYNGALQSSIFVIMRPATALGLIYTHSTCTSKYLFIYLIA